MISATWGALDFLTLTGGSVDISCLEDSSIGDLATGVASVGIVLDELVNEDVAPSVDEGITREFSLMDSGESANNGRMPLNGDCNRALYKVLSGDNGAVEARASGIRESRVARKVDSSSSSFGVSPRFWTAPLKVGGTIGGSAGISKPSAFRAPSDSFAAGCSDSFPAGSSTGGNVGNATRKERPSCFVQQDDPSYDVRLH